MRGPRTAMKSGPHLPQLEKALAQKRRPNTAINKQKLKKKKVHENLRNYEYVFQKKNTELLSFKKKNCSAFFDDSE